MRDREEMSATSHRKIGWLVQPLLALLTVGLANASGENRRPSGTIHALAGHSALPPQSIKKQSVGLALENCAVAPSPVAVAETKSVQPERLRNCDWQKAHEFQLPARLAVTAQMNQPKSRISRPKKTRTVSSAGFGSTNKILLASSISFRSLFFINLYFAVGKTCAPIST